MPQPAADRNLLFGILAVQLDFIGRDDLIAAMNAWVLDKAKPLGDILLALGKLTKDRLQLLEALVREHLKQHDNDPEKSLAAISSLDSLGEHLKSALGDADVSASLAHLSATRMPQLPDGATLDFPAQAIPGPGAAPGGSRFRVLRLHAKGGLGQVSVAIDSELQREVALKELQDHHARSSDSRVRFVQEAEITGGLEHPGIVPVYGLGYYGDGRPFYAMRFIRGDSLKDAIDRFHQRDRLPLAPSRALVSAQVGTSSPSPPSAGGEGRGEGVGRGRDASSSLHGWRDPSERSLELRNLLARFVDVCNAVAYAHSRGVLHGLLFLFLGGEGC